MNLQQRDGHRYLETEPARVTFAMALFLPLITTAAVAARIYARLQRRLKLGSDDWLAVSALASSLQSPIYTLPAVTCFLGVPLLPSRRCIRLFVVSMRSRQHTLPYSCACRHLPRILWASLFGCIASTAAGGS